MKSFEARRHGTCQDRIFSIADCVDGTTHQQYNIHTYNCSRRTTTEIVLSEEQSNALNKH